MVGVWRTYEETAGELVKRNKEISPHPTPQFLLIFVVFPRPKNELFHQGSFA